jgi:hypothetical protein
MRQALVAWVAATVSLAAMAAAPQASYYVVLRDGSWVRAAEKPTVEEGMAHIRLRSGLLALVEAERIDWRRSDERSRQIADLLAPAPPPQPEQPVLLPRESVPGEITIINPPGHAPAAETPAAPAAAPPAAPEPTATSQAASLRGRINTLDAGIAELQERQRDLEQRAHESYNLDDAAKLRQQAQQIEGQIQQLRSEKERLLRQLWNVQQP